MINSKKSPPGGSGSCAGIKAPAVGSAATCGSELPCDCPTQVNRAAFPMDHVYANKYLPVHNEIVQYGPEKKIILARISALIKLHLVAYFTGSNSSFYQLPCSSQCYETFGVDKENRPLFRGKPCNLQQSSKLKTSNEILSCSKQVRGKRPSRLNDLFLLSILVLLAFCLNDAPSCHGFGFTEHDYDNDNFYAVSIA